MKKVVIFASGSGSNAENIILYFKNNNQVNIASVFTNNINAKVLEKAKQLKTHTEVFDKTQLSDGAILNKINKIKPDLIVLAGFLLKFPESIIQAYPNKIINIHPALLPKYGGKGMYGMNVHRAVLENKETKTGITIHYVNKNYDEGEFIFQKNVSITNCKTPEEIAVKIHELEMECFPKEIEKLLIPKT
ncbi:phosphoribosylglycinamide formyltransferase [Flavobacterium psychrophilum]|uniref:phosphoribosylglycinamide formyltransferase n=1 Tax=Flavobacterium psychrophilum TaxID=96345 RepID=UPI00073ECD30|nr:phosphoribosylglycinamide formyltransferase [Flavobacterium psychrophilum]SNA65766.1 Phosphoribosylglycinamide formyltransferase [Flavobacterium psychrophilum]SNB96151.1 Phosphoribosylglycinamide formyltransferase [Flavobacterium psychrophilum]GAQ49090.1 phosphoribosylglycinamide formyltransferase [Flavobacterium psychrophilum]GAW89744.1 phosphoribosylglycinamide formyltransferase [Flavobacterium psychrophilum]GEJ31115.1 phosphoribosylglycinamide formyltransferase [Flavobacterium psychrophi